MIQNFMSPVADYGEAVQMAPGTFTTNSNGVGLGQSKTYFRGFPDGDYDIKFDGIPFYDTNSASHHSWAFFPSQFLGGIDFDRSPGTASTIGLRAFGGSIHLLSKPFSPVAEHPRRASPYGSFNTCLYDGEYDSGSFGPGHKFNLMLDVHHLHRTATRPTTTRPATPATSRSSTSSPTRPSSPATPASSGWTPTPRTSTRPAARCTVPAPAIPAPAPTLPFAGSGINFLLTNNSDPLLYLDYQYNYYHVPTDFEYVGVHKEFGKGWLLDVKPYTYNYDNSEKYSNAVPITDDASSDRHHLRSPRRHDHEHLQQAGRRTSTPAASTSTTATARTARPRSSARCRSSAFCAPACGTVVQHQPPPVPGRPPPTTGSTRRCPTSTRTSSRTPTSPSPSTSITSPRSSFITPGVKFSYFTIGTKQFADNGGKIGCRARHATTQPSFHRQRWQLLRDPPLGRRELPHSQQLVGLCAVRHRYHCPALLHL